ncbi:MAG: precorrin-6A reductase [Desulfobacteraceae bacterium]|nr:precorrin-6A reductase [Desulfobacteraceae bacterium]
MILLLGGTSDTAPIARGLAGLKIPVLVSTATRIKLNVGDHDLIHRHCGCLDSSGLSALIQKHHIRMMVDATHPYAVNVSQNAGEVARKLDIPLLVFARPESDVAHQDIILAADHLDAAQKAFVPGKPVLLTTGSRNLAPYVQASTQTGQPLTARILDGKTARKDAYAQGLLDGHLICERGPFSVEQNLAHIRLSDAGVMVTKDGGTAGGLPEKLEAAKQSKCLVVMVQRPPINGCEQIVCKDYESLIRKVQKRYNASV